MQEGFSTDGYIIDQNLFAAYPYREMTSDINGCGWIAAYNLCRALGRDITFDDVRREMDGMFRLRIPGPTPMGKLRRYLRRYIQFRFYGGKRAALRAAASSDAGILRYWEGREPHFITFIRQADGSYRFMNVSDGQEDITAPMEEFFRGHCRMGYIRVIVGDRHTGTDAEEGRDAI